MIRGRYRSWGAEVSSMALRQSVLPLGAIPVGNPCGTAPGIAIPGEPGRCPIVLLPGFPTEAGPLLPLCLGALGLHGRVVREERRTIRLWGVGESQLVEAVPGLQRPAGTSVSIVPSHGRLDVALDGGDAAVLEARIREAFPRHVYSDSQERSLEDALADLLGARDLTLAVAESCTGGLVAKLLTDRPGASAWFLGGVTVYADALKTSLLGVPRELLEEHGAVSTACAEAMAAGVWRLTGAGLSGAVTGIAGPGGAVPGKPVGTVCFAVRGPGDRSVSEERRFRGTREAVRSAASAWLLGMLLEAPSGEAGR